MLKITEDFIGDVSNKAKLSPRMRTNHNFHKSYDDTVQRLLNAAEPGTYIQPHKHESPDKVEVFIILAGSVVMVEFDDSGKPVDHAVLGREKGVFGVEIPPRTWHTFITLKPGSVLYEVKEGPYRRIDDKNFAPWAPKEGAPEAKEFNRKVLRAIKIDAAFL